MSFMNKEIDNMKASKILCNELNKDTNDSAIFLPMSTSSVIGVKQVLDKKFLHYNIILFKDTIKDMELFQQVAHVYVCLGTGNFETILLSDNEREIYYKLKENGWLENKAYDLISEDIKLDDYNAKKINIDKDTIEVVENGLVKKTIIKNK